MDKLSFKGQTYMVLFVTGRKSSFSKKRPRVFQLVYIYSLLPWIVDKLSLRGCWLGVGIQQYVAMDRFYRKSYYVNMASLPPVASQISPINVLGCSNWSIFTPYNRG
jgi:hypothetical protein